jgi:PilZ domain-containing protein
METPRYEGTERRRKPRKPAAVPVKLRGTGPQARPTVACTLDISSEGARLNVAGWAVEPGEIINVERGTEKSMFRIAWVGDPNTPRRGQIGIQCLEQGKSIFQDKDEAKSESAKNDLMRLLSKK